MFIYRYERIRFHSTPFHKETALKKTHPMPDRSFEKFAGTEEQGKYVAHFNGVTQTSASQGSREDAHTHPSLIQANRKQAKRSASPAKRLKQPQSTLGAMLHRRRRRLRKKKS
jgi:hypothetical protein